MLTGPYRELVTAGVPCLDVVTLLLHYTPLQFTSSPCNQVQTKQALYTHGNNMTYSTTWHIMQGILPGKVAYIHMSDEVSEKVKLNELGR